jgi:hypothetical protein
MSILYTPFNIIHILHFFKGLDRVEELDFISGFSIIILTVPQILKYINIPTLNYYSCQKRDAMLKHLVRGLLTTLVLPLVLTSDIWCWHRDIHFGAHKSNKVFIFGI